MNVIFHASVAIAITTSLINVNTKENSLVNRKNVLTGGLAFIIGVVFHGVLDYIPHCYPVNSKLDILISLFLFGLGNWSLKKNYKLIFTLSFLGSIFPDLIDLSSQILNKLLSIHLPIYHNFFPWHWKQYSGSLYSGDCNVSGLNHIMVLFVVVILLYLKRADLSKMFTKDYNS